MGHFDTGVGEGGYQKIQLPQRPVVCDKYCGSLNEEEYKRNMFEMPNVI